MTSQFLSSQLKPKRDNENCSLGAIFLSLVGLKVECPFFFSFLARNHFLGNCFFFVDARHIHTLSRSLSISKQTLFRDGRDSKPPCASEEKKPQVMPGTQNNSQKKQTSSWRREESKPKKKRREEERKKGRTCCFVKAVRVRVLESPRFRPTPVVLAPRSEKKVTRYRVCDM